MLRSRASHARLVCCCLSALAAAALAPASAAPTESFAFTILRENDPVGHDAYVIATNGDEKTVHVETQSDAKVLFISFHYRHSRTEVWKGDTLVRFTSDTDDDGTKHHVEAHQEGGMLIGTVDGARKTLPGNAIPFTLWTHDLLTPSIPLFDIQDFAPLKVQFIDKGNASLSLPGRTVAVHHYQVIGDLQWELWYAADGTLLKTAFKRLGYPISFVRQ